MSVAGDTMRGRKHPPDCGHCSAVRSGNGGRPRTRQPDDYHARHYEVGKVRGKASDYLCEGGCGGRAAQWATIHGHDGLDIMLDYVPLCVHCHFEYDRELHVLIRHKHSADCPDSHKRGRKVM